jgi:hypothetical protein
VSESDADSPAGAGRRDRSEPDLEEENLDLTDLDRVGIGGVVDRMRAASGGDGDDLQFEPPSRPRRTPVLSLAVVLFGIYLLAEMWPDFRFWLRSSEPVDLGKASDLVQNGKMPDDLHDTFVTVEGTPDVQNALRMPTKDGYIGYRRITEAGGQLFAAVPRDKEAKVVQKFETQYRGRMKRLGGDEPFEALQKFFRDEGVVRTIDSTPDALASALQRGGELQLETAEGRIAVDATRTLRVVGRLPEVRVQLGVSTFRDAEAAEQAIAALGYPWIATGTTPTFHAFVARIPESEREAVERKLETDVPAGANLADPKIGAAVLPVSVSYRVLAKDLALEGDALVLPRADNTASPGWDLEGDKLVERVEQGGKVRLPLSIVKTVRIEEPIEVDPDGYVVVVGTEPADKRWVGLGWLAVLLLVLVNAASLLWWWRRRRPAHAG